MMRETPRTFVGSVAFLLEVPLEGQLAETVTTEVGKVAGIGHCALDLATGALVVTAEAPVDRTEVVAALERLGCGVRA